MPRQLSDSFLFLLGSPTSWLKRPTGFQVYRSRCGQHRAIRRDLYTESGWRLNLRPTYVVTISRVLLLAFEHGKSLYHGMKLLTLLALAFLVAFSPFAVASPRHPATHITRNEAQHLALRDYPGGRVTAANLDRSRGRPVWQIAIAEPNANAVVHLSVDATSGRVLSGAKASR